MGRYMDASDLYPSLMAESVVAQLTNGGDGSATTIDTAVLDQVVEGAESEIDGYVGARFALPLPSVPSQLTAIAARITRYRLYTSRGGEVETWLTNDYNRDLKVLEAIRDGKMDLGLTAAGEAPGASSSASRRVRASSVAPVFGRDNFGDY